MKKTPTLFIRDFENNPRLVTRNVSPSCQWVIDGEGIATQKHDGTAVMVQGGTFFKRYEHKKNTPPPADFIPAQDPDPVTGHIPGWVPVRRDDPSNRWIFAVIDASTNSFDDGTYELVGPRINGNPDNHPDHLLVRHGSVELPDAPRDYDALVAYLATHAIEGIVWHHPDGRYAKIKARDLGIAWPRKHR